MHELTLTINGRPQRIEGDPHTTLLSFLRARGLTGTKEGCAEGECGACAVLLLRRDAAGRTRYEPVNSCLVLVAALAGEELWTVEGLAREGALHPVQESMVATGGSQCGYCTPGFVVSLFAEYYRPGRDAGASEGGWDPESIGGNLCRCTGYRPIRDVGRALGAPAMDDPFVARLEGAPPELVSTLHESDGRRLHRPSGLAELFSILKREPGARLVAGGTDVVVEVNQRDARFDALVSLEAIAELRGVRWEDDALVIGAAEPLSHLEDHLAGRLPMLEQLLPLFSSRLVRNRATLGGNIVNASPIGDGPPALLALDAELSLASADGERTVPLEGFFTGYRQTALRPGEILESVRVPRPFARIQRFYKVSKRELDDISTVAAAFALDLDRDGMVTKARLAYGGVAATPVRAHDAERVLEGAIWSVETVGRARTALEGAFSPISDHRGSAEYRQAMVLSLLDKLWAETAPSAPPAEARP